MQANGNIAVNGVPPARPYYTRRGYRIASALLGAGLIVAAVVLLASAAPMTWLQLLTAGVLALLGGNLVISARAAREPWLSRLGPLP